MGHDKPNMKPEFPHADAWYKRMLERPTVQNILADQDNALKFATLGPAK